MQHRNQSRGFVVSLIAFLALSLAGPGCRTPAPPAAPSTSGMYDPPTPVTVAHASPLQAPGERIRVCTYNIQDFTDGEDDGYMRTQAVSSRQADTAARIINQINPDVIVLEEIENDTVLQELNERLDPPFPVAYVTRFGDRGRGTKRNIGALSRFPFLKVSELDFEEVEASVHLARGSLVFVVDLGSDHLLLVYAVHLKSNFGKEEGKGEANIAKRQEALRLVRRHADTVMRTNTSKQWEVIVAGDMNVDPELEAFKTDESLKPFEDWDDLWRGRPLPDRITIPTRYGDPALQYDGACFDRMIVSPGLQKKPWTVGQIQVLQRGVDTENVFTQAGQNELHASDHYPVFVDILR